MKVISKLSIRNKLFLVAIVPILGLLYYLTASLGNELRKKADLEEVIVWTQDIILMSELVHQIQLERAVTQGFFFDFIPRDRLYSQFTQTDQKITQLRQYLLETGHTQVNLFLFDEIQVHRQQVLTKNDIGEPYNYYIDLSDHLNDATQNVIRITDHNVARNLIENHVNLVNTKEFLARVRGFVMVALTDTVLSYSENQRFGYLNGRYEYNLDLFIKTADDYIIEIFNSTFSGPAIDTTRAFIRDIADNSSSVRLGMDPTMWFEMATLSVNKLEEVEQISINRIQTFLGNEIKLVNREVLIQSVIALVILLIVLTIILLIVKDLLNSIRVIKGAADEIADGDLTIELNLDSRDEFKELADAFSRMIDVSRHFATAAEKIGEGDYNAVVDVRNESDTLGLALVDMRDKLSRLSNENERRTWLLTGSAGLNDVMRGDKEIIETLQAVIHYVSGYLNAKVGAIYVSENGHFIMKSSFAFDRRKSHSSSFEMGESLVGQSAMEKKPIIYDNLPPDYITISSGLGDTVPTSLIIYPFLFNNEVVAILELGFPHSISSEARDFLDMVSENIAISISSANARTRMKELLMETQRQAEELEAQQEELRQTNEELIEKTELLEKSEAELKTQQEELQQTNEELEEKANLLEVQKDSLETAKMEIENKARELEVTSKYKSEFLANMSHELRTPLNSILILSQLLLDNKNSTLGVKEVEHARNIYNSGNDLLNLINEILDLSKVEAGRLELDIEQHAISEIKNDILNMFSEVAVNRKIEFKVEISDDDISTIQTDKLRLEQILRNLISNAFKFTDLGGSVSLNVKKAGKDVDFRSRSLQLSRSNIAFEVTDTGIGIPESRLGLIFEAFQQGDGSTKRKYGGTGLGLSISRELAYVLGGEIHVDSEEGVGSTFTLFIPTAFSESNNELLDRMLDVRKSIETPKSARKQITANTADTLSKDELLQMDSFADDRYNIYESDRVVLIMEDDPEFAKILYEFVTSRSYKGIVALQGTTGLSFARHYRPDAIILDMKMPGMDGSEVLKHLKHDPELRHIPVQIISGYDRRKESLELGAFDFLSKPVSHQDLKNGFEKIEEFINKKLKQLLIVEDNKQQNEVIKELIGNGDVKSDQAFSGSQGLEMMNSKDYDCVIVDLGLPDMSGFDLLEKIKGNESLKKTPIIVYTGRDLTKAESNRLIKYANTVILKTVDSHERLLDETMLFLHRVESKLPKEKQNIIRKLHKTDEILKNRKILVVDDDIRNIYSLTNVLETEGLICITAEDGREAINTLKKNPDIELVLMDVMMPIMDGYEATREIRQMDRYNKIPIIALTAKAMKGDREKCLDAGMSDYISKPVNIDKLLSLLRVWLYN